MAKKVSLIKRFKVWLHHYLLPHEHNHYRAKAIHTKSLAVYLFFALLLNLVWQIGTTHFPDVLGYATDVTVSKLLELTNQERINAGLTPLTYDERLASAAALKADNMFQNNYWAHYGPNGETPWQYILTAGYQYEYAGENLAKNFAFSQDIVKAWMDSPAHRDNILKGHYQNVGFAVVNGVLEGEPTTLVVQMFGKQPASLLQSQQIKMPAVASLTDEVSPTPKLSELKAQVAPVKQVRQESNLTIIEAKPLNKPGLNLGGALINMRLIFIIILVLVLLIDLYVATKFKLVRTGSKNLINIIFLTFIVVGIITAAIKGGIL